MRKKGRARWTNTAMPSQPTQTLPAYHSLSFSTTSFILPSFLLMAHSYPSQQPVSDAVLRRRSADVGGLHLAIRHETQGQGWLDSTGSDAIIEYVLLSIT